MTAQWKKQPRAIFVVVGILSTLFFCKGVILERYERLAYKMAPTAGRAMAYADGHFNASGGWKYDIAFAEYFYRQAALLDPSYPYLNHQLARIEFLKGNFNTALLLVNREIELQGNAAPASYYVRGLIEGYMGDYAAAAKDYERYLTFDSLSWAAHNDYAWVLLKAGRATEAVRVTEKGLVYFPENVWLLNTSAIALYETNDLPRARTHAEKAVALSSDVTEAEWLHAYPGNDPRVAAEGLAALRTSARDNMHMIEAALASSTVQ